MTLSRDVVVPNMLLEYQAFGELLRSLSPEEWESPSRCEGWRAADVAAHVVGQLSDVVSFRLDGLGTPEVTKRQTDERRGRTAGELAEELDAGVKTAQDIAAAFDDAAWSSEAPGGVAGTLGFGIEALWFDTYLHADDIRAALGRRSVPSEAIVGSLSHISQELTNQGYGPATLRLDGYEEFPISGGGGAAIGGDAYTFILVSTGRGDPAVLGLDETINIYR